MPSLSLAIVLQHLPRLRAAMSDVLGIAPGHAHFKLDLAEALACDDGDRTEVVTVMQGRFGVAISRIEAAACESVADLLRLLTAQESCPA